MQSRRREEFDLLCAKATLLAMKARILLIDDDEAFTSMLAAGLRYAGLEVIIAPNGATGREYAASAQPDIILLDWRLPDCEGPTLCRDLHTLSAAPIIMLTARDAVSDRVAGLDAGAEDYLVKPFHLDELLARIRARLRSRRPSEQELVFEDLTLDLKLHEAERNGRRIKLTATEFRLLHLLMQRPRQVLSKETILDQIWGYHFAGDTNIVEQYIRNLRQKLGPPPLIQTIRAVGYILRAEE